MRGHAESARRTTSLNSAGTAAAVKSAGEAPASRQNPNPNSQSLLMKLSRIVPDQVGRRQSTR